MKAAVFNESNAPFDIKDYPLDAPEAGMASVDLDASGICGTDVHIWEGALGFVGPMIIGHEFIGRVRALGEGEHADCLGQPVKVGDRVAVNVIESCGECLLCKTGGAASCLHLGESITYTQSPEKPPHLHGGFAEATVCPVRYLHKIPEDIPTDVASAFLCAGPTVARAVVYAGGIKPDEHVVVQGGGPVGLFAALYAKNMGAGSVTVIASGSNPLRLELAKEFSEGVVLDIKTTTLEERKEAVMNATGGLGADFIIEGTGNPDAILEGLGLLRLRGRYVWAGQYSDRGTVAFPTHLVTFNALQIFGSAQFTVEDRVKYFDFLLEAKDKWNTISRVITHKYNVGQANEAIQTVRSGKAVKAVFTR